MKLHFLLPVAAALVLAACNHEVRPSAGSYTLSTAYRGIDCGRADRAPAAVWIDDRAALERAYTRLRRRSMDPPPMPEVDFETYGLLLVELGQRPSAGYGLRLASERMVLDKGEGVVTLELVEPSGVAAQVVTSPCLLVAVPRSDITTVRAATMDNRLRLYARVR